MSFAKPKSRQQVVDSSSMPALRRAWDYVPSPMRRVVVRLLKSERVRVNLLNALGVRDRNEFASLSRGLGVIDRMMERLKQGDVVGDYYEFGLFRGYSFWHAQQSADRQGIEGMQFYGFDSFSGMPEVQGRDRDSGLFFSGDYRCSREEVAAQLSEHGFDWSRGQLIEGYFDESLTPELRVERRMGPAALVMVDCDLYQSTVPVLRFLAPLLQEGTIMLFDDWHCFGDSDAAERGEPRAFREFLSEHEEWRAEMLMDFPVYGRAFVLHKQSAGE